MKKRKNILSKAMEFIKQGRNANYIGEIRLITAIIKQAFIDYKTAKNTEEIKELEDFFASDEFKNYLELIIQYKKSADRA